MDVWTFVWLMFFLKIPIVALFRQRQTIQVDELNSLKN